MRGMPVRNPFGGDLKSYPAQIPGLTSLRFFAALWVVLYHYTWWLTPASVPALELPIVAQGYLAAEVVAFRQRLLRAR